VSGYTKLFGSILESTVWDLPAASKIVWITMLVMVDRDGVVQASVPGLAKRANVSIEECESALQSFLSPDRYSRTKDNEGRRIKEVDGGWLLLNYVKYRELMSADDVREKAAIRQQEWRQRHPKSQKVTESNARVTASNASNDIVSVSVSVSEPVAENPDRNTPASRARVSSGRKESEAFQAFYAAFPRHVGRLAAWRAWRAKGCEYLAAEVMAAISWQNAKVFAGCPVDKVPHPATWLNAGRWEDEQPRQTTIARSARPSGPPVAIAEAMGQRAAKDAAERERERLADAEKFRQERERDAGVGG
jgi:hypothetical protein